ncbi:unnamed protein product, partial [Ectocarpus fasciculatus]
QRRRRRQGRGSLERGSGRATAGGCGGRERCVERHGEPGHSGSRFRLHRRAPGVGRASRDKALRCHGPHARARRARARHGGRFPRRRKAPGGLQPVPDALRRCRRRRCYRRGAW